MILTLLFIETFLIGALIGTYLKPEESKMDINKFAVLVSKKEGLKKELSVAQIKEVLNVINQLMGGFLYWFIRLVPEKEFKKGLK